MIWILHICIGATWAGCGSVRNEEYQSEDSCYRALASIRTGGEPFDKRNIVAYCKPKQPEAK